MTESENWTWKDTVLLLTSFPVVLGARLLWQSYPGFWPCLLFWVVGLADEPLRWAEMRFRRRCFYGAAFIGGVMNAAATLANGGYMPVLGKTEEPTSLWVPLTESSRLHWLCDIYDGWSLGDFFIIGALLVLFMNWLCEKSGLIDPEPRIKGKNMPGVGIWVN